MVSSSSSSSSSSSKRIRNGSLMSSCLVDGCVSDLSRCKEYHRKHKVCDIHSKTPIVMVGGREQRFCQQCSRFHLLMEFDGEKRSCRKRLEGHNRRRRKPQLHSLNPEAFLTHQGSRFISSYPQIFSTNSNTWAPAPKAAEMPVYHQGLVFNGHPHNNYEHFPVSSRGVYNNENLDAAASTSTACQRKLFESECALSLLSSPTSGDRISSMGQQQQQPRIHSMPMHYHDAFRASSSNASISHNNGFFYSGVMEHEQGGSVLISGSSSSDADLYCRGLPHEQAGSVLISGSTSNDADLYCHGLLHEQGSSNANSHAALSFSWQ